MLFFFAKLSYSVVFVSRNDRTPFLFYVSLTIFELTKQTPIGPTEFLNSTVKGASYGMNSLHRDDIATSGEHWMFDGSADFIHAHPSCGQLFDC